MRTPGFRRRGAGAIIGAAFVLLVIISGYSLYILQANTQAQSQAIFSEMNQRDLAASQEILTFNNLEKYPNNRIKLNVTNTGPLSIHITYIAIIDKSVAPETQTYTIVDTYVNAGDTYVTPDSAGTPSTTSADFLTQLVTERGNLYQTSYPFAATGGGGTTPDQVTQIIQNFYTGTTGDISMDYRSIQNAYRSGYQVSGLTFVNDWEVSRTQYICWRMNVTNNAATAISINSNTQVRFIRPGGTTVVFYIVGNQGTYANPSLVTYSGLNMVTIDPGKSATLYFAAATAGANPTGSRVQLSTAAQYVGFLLLYDTTQQYGQTIPYIAINAV